MALALVVTVRGTRPLVSVAMIQDFLRTRFSLEDAVFDVRNHAPEDFVVRFRHAADRERVLLARQGGALLPQIWRPWRRNSQGLAARFWFRVVVALSRVPLHARSLEVAQTVLGPSCAELAFSDFRDRPIEDDREFFVSAWCWHPDYIQEQQVIYIPEPHIPGVLVEDHLPGLWYLVRVRLVDTAGFSGWRGPLLTETLVGRMMVRWMTALPLGVTATMMPARWTATATVTTRGFPVRRCWWALWPARWRCLLMAQVTRPHRSPPRPCPWQGPPLARVWLLASSTVHLSCYMMEGVPLAHRRCTLTGGRKGSTLS